MKLSVHRYAEDFWDDSDYTEEQLDTDELKTRLIEIALELPEIKADTESIAIKIARYIGMTNIQHFPVMICLNMDIMML